MVGGGGGVVVVVGGGGGGCCNLSVRVLLVLFSKIAIRPIYPFVQISMYL